MPATFQVATALAVLALAIRAAHAESAGAAPSAAKPPVTDLDGWTPESFDFTMGGNRALHVWWQDGRLKIRETGGGLTPMAGHVFRSEEKVPGPEEWKRFWSNVKSLGVWEWQPLYRSAQSQQMDGVGWTLKLARGGRHLDSRGYNALPPQWDQFMAAVRELSGG